MVFWGLNKRNSRRRVRPSSFHSQSTDESHRLSSQDKSLDQCFTLVNFQALFSSTPKSFLETPQKDGNEDKAHTGWLQREGSVMLRHLSFWTHFSVFGGTHA